MAAVEREELFVGKVLVSSPSFLGVPELSVKLQNWGTLPEDCCLSFTASCS